MTNRLEQNVRQIFLEDDATYDTAEAVARIHAIDFRHRMSRRRRLLAMIGTSGTALTGGIVATVLLLSSNASVAYADWSPTPVPASASAIASASRACGGGTIGTNSGAYQRAFSQQPLLAETRGVSTALVEISDGRVYSCVTGHNPRLSSPAFKISGYGATMTTPAADRITAPYQLRSGVGGGYIGPFVPRPSRFASQTARLKFAAARESHGFGLSALGQAGSDVNAVSFDFADGRSVAATVQNGWYFAWWPQLAEPTSVTVISTSGNLTSPVKSQGPIVHKSIVPGCQPDATGCVFAKTRSTPATTHPSTGSQTASTVTNAAP